MIKEPYKTGLLDRGITFQNNLNQKRIQKRINKERRYKEFLADPPRSLPDFETLSKWRIRLFIVIIIIMSIPSIQILLFYSTCFIGDTCVIPFTCTLTAMILSGFYGAIDWSIYRRWGNKKSIIDW